LTLVSVRAALESMSRARPRSTPRRSAGLVLALFAAVSLFAALLLQGGPCPSFRLPDKSLGGPCIRTPSRGGAIEAVPRRLAHEARRDSRTLDAVPEPVLLGALSSLRAPLTLTRVRRVPAGQKTPRGDISHFRRRIPRMNAEEPPSV
jgi:hypothetical protein